MSYPLERLVARDLATRNDTLRQLSAIVAAQLASRPPSPTPPAPVAAGPAPEAEPVFETEPRLQAAGA